MAAGWFTPRQERPAREVPPAAPRRRWLWRITDRIQPVAPFTDSELTRREPSSRSRNRTDAVAGLLVYDKGRLLQWLEGPVEGLRRVWRSIQPSGGQHGRSLRTELLGNALTPLRFFDNWEFKGVRRRLRGDALRSPAVPGSPQAPTASVLRHGEAVAVAGTVSSRLGPLRPALTSLIEQAVIPRLAAAHPANRRVLAADPRAAELAHLLFAKEASGAYALIDLLRADVDSIESLCAELFEPAARTMGDLWRNDDCSEFDVTLGLGRLQLALHRCSAGDSAAVRPGSDGRAVLLAPSPHEPHLLGSAVAVELFWRAGWDVSCDFPASADTLNQRLHEHWFDVLDLSLSSAFTREHRLEALAATIRAARANSLNPALAVIVDGRLFHEQPLACAAVGADASCACALELLPTVERQLSRARLH